MPVEPSSRYREQQAHLAPDADGAAHPAIPARWGTGTATEVVYHTLAAGESFETLADEFFGSSALWWRIADANPLVFPLALVPGTVLAIPSGGSRSGPPRTRSW